VTEQLVVDGYNIIHAWPELKRWVDTDLSMARTQLVEILRDYQGWTGMLITIVFDAYQTNALEATIERYEKVTVVYTKNEESADQYIERLVARLKHPKRRVRVATSDWLQQTLVMGQGAIRMSANELGEEVKRAKKLLNEQYLQAKTVHKNNLEQNIAPDILKELERMRTNHK
jgi:predicted RNA-binding protein with PIN domain